MLPSLFSASKVTLKSHNIINRARNYRSSKVSSSMRTRYYTTEQEAIPTVDYSKIGGKLEVNERVEKAVTSLEKLSFVELVCLVQVMEKKYGYSALDLAVGASAPSGGSGNAAAAEGAAAEAEPEAEAAPVQKDLTLKLIGYPAPKKIHLLKEIRKLKPGMNLMESKKIVDELPSTLMRGLNDETFAPWKKILEEFEAEYTLEEN
eukprot:TRINITY_DN1733_c0_g1_i1.p1 TRINITY_DN1733_c0_g1~~TRINITY_DN1733_c0_g1_i1.p1  ORF type:complete len:205 (+),score=67.91 TRINITY_DN1733_c0_g1_i1:36-650(+)